jgi:hypothetical protein
MDDLVGRAALNLSDRDVAQRIAGILERRRFVATHIGRRGVGFQGSRELFESVFECAVEVTHEGARFLGEPKLLEEFGGHVESVYFPTAPIDV